MRSYYAKICSNGHVLVDRNPVSALEYCEQCGAEMLSKCPFCNASIKEWHYDDHIISRAPRYAKPLYCKSCGEPYPWTKAALDGISLIIQEDSELSDLERKHLEESLPDLISETPKSNLASIRIKKAFLSAGKFTADALRQFVIDFGCEFVKKSIGL